MSWIVLSSLVFVLAVIPASMIAVNLFYFRRAPQSGPAEDDAPPAAVSVLIPARNEADSIGACLEHVLASEGVELEVIVMNDRSTDATAEVVRKIAADDARVKLLDAPALPPGWCGKQHACHNLAQLARHDRLVWIDADVRLSPTALARTAAFMARTGAPLVSGFPHQVCRTWSEALVVPLIQLVLLGYLPLGQMRKSVSPSFAAGCGQLFMADRATYEKLGGHGTIRATLHDGIMLPRAFRLAGHHTDVFDAQDIARCRMYHSPRTVWDGFAKNATEGLATPIGIWVWTLLLFGGHVLPWLHAAIVLAVQPEAAAGGAGIVAVLTASAVLLAVASNMMIGWRFQQPWISVLLRPLGVMIMLAIQWYAYLRNMVGQPVSWRGRDYAAE